MADDTSWNDQLYNHTHRVGRLVRQLFTEPQRVSTLGTLVGEVVGGWFYVTRRFLYHAFFALLKLVGLLLVAAAFEYTPRLWRDFSAKYDAWNEDRWVTDCAKYSEIPDCRRRYHQLERDRD